MTDKPSIRLIPIVLCAPGFHSRQYKEQHIECNAIIDDSLEESRVGTSILKRNSLGGNQGSNDYPANMSVICPNGLRRFVPDPDDKTRASFFTLYSFDDANQPYELVIGARDLDWIRELVNWSWFPLKD